MATNENRRSETSETNQPVINEDTNFSWDDFKVSPAETQVNVKTDSASVLGEATIEKCTKIMNILCKSKKANPSHMMLAVATLMQKGATNPRASETMTATIGTVSVTVKEIRDACKKENVTTRQFARGMKDKIADTMLSLGNFATIGNLSKLAMADVPDLSTEELIWASDFQTYNQRCPERVKRWLLFNFGNRFRNK